MAGMSLAATSAWIGASHAPSPDMATLIWALAAAGAVAAALLPRMGWWAIPAFLSIVSAEVYNGMNTAERMLEMREKAQLAAVAEADAKKAAAAAVAFEEAAVAKAEAEAAAEAKRGGCGRTCKDLRADATAARTRLEDARKAAASVKPPRSESLLATFIGVRPVDVSVAQAALGVLAGLLSLPLLAFAHAPASARKGESEDEIKARLRKEVDAEAAATARRKAAAAKAKATRAANKAAKDAAKAAIARAQAAVRTKHRAANDNGR
jgi:hypothetical protein